jgi:hypothetical protein
MLGGLLVAGQLSGSAGADEYTVSQDTLRTGWDQFEPALSPSTIVGSNFGQLFATQLTGQIYAQPLVVGSTVVVNTEDDWVYGLNANTGSILWSRNFGPAWPASVLGCADLTPNLGSTSTGVYDPSTNYVYLTTKVNDGPSATQPNWYLHAVNVTTGAERPGWPVHITGYPINDPAHPFIGETVNQRPGLLLMNGAVYLGFGSQCDLLAGQYVGYVVGVDTNTQAITMWSDEVGASSQEAGIWHGGGGLMSDGSGRIFVATGNGVTAPDRPGSNPPQQLSQSVIRLGVGTNGALSAQDFFSPSNASVLDQNDQDLGSGGPVGLPGQYFGTPNIPNLMVEMGKDGRLFLLNRDHLGGKNQKAGGGDDVVQTLGPFLGVWGHPAVYGGSGGYVYFVQNSNTMLAFKYGTDGSGNPALSLAGNTAETFGYTSGSPIVTSDGTKTGTAVVWVVSVGGPNGSGGQLCGYDAVPVNNHINLLRCFPIGTGVKFTTPASSNGRVYVGTRDGKLFGFGSPTTAALSVAQTNVGNVQVGATGTGTVTVTATRAVTINGVSTLAPFTVNPPALPVTLAAGQTFSVPVTFTPTAPGSITSSVTFAVNDNGTAQSLGAPVQGTGIKPGFWPTPGTLSFGQVPTGAQKSLTVSFTNTGTADETVSGVTAPTGPFTATGMPATGTVLAPGQSVAVSVTYKPTSAGDQSSTIGLTGPSGTATATLAGTAVTGVAQLSISPSGVDFGTIPVGASTTRQLVVSNTGNLNVTITKAAPPALPFVVNTPLPEGQVLSPGDEVVIQVVFAPSAAGTFNNLYIISSDDGHGAHNVPITGTAVNPASGAPLPPVSAGAWVFNGSAAVSGQSLVLNPAVSSTVGSAVYSTPLPSDGMSATFTATIGGGTGADGMTFAMLDASAASPRSIGPAGGALGFYGLPGVAVVLDTYQNGTDPSANFIGIATGGTTTGIATFAATTSNIPDLRTGSHVVGVQVSGGQMAVSLDGVPKLSAAVTLPASVLPAFTGSSGGRYDQHAVSNVSITSGASSLPRPGAGWRFNGAAALNAADVVLTPTSPSVAGSALYSQPVATNGLTASFTLTIGGGTGADGATFAMLDPSQPATSLGSAGGGLGFAGLAGVAVAFVTYPQSGINSFNFVGIMTGTAGGTPTFVASNTNIPDLRSGPRSVAIAVNGTTVTVSLDGQQVLNTTVAAVKPTATVGFTGGTGGRTDIHKVSDAGIVAGVNRVPAPPATGWTLNGNATANGGTFQLTPIAMDQAGTAIFNNPIPTGQLDARFTLKIGDGTGADGLAFMLLDPANSSPTSLGRIGGGLGYAGLTGPAVTFITYQSAGYPSDNFVGITAQSSGPPLTFVATNTNIPPLRTGTHAVEITVSQTTGHVVVFIDGSQVLDAAVTIPANARIGFSGGAGGRTDIHAVSDLDIRF